MNVYTFTPLWGKCIKVEVISLEFYISGARAYFNSIFLWYTQKYAYYTLQKSSKHLVQQNSCNEFSKSIDSKFLCNYPTRPYSSILVPSSEGITITCSTGKLGFFDFAAQVGLVTLVVIETWQVAVQMCTDYLHSSTLTCLKLKSAINFLYRKIYRAIGFTKGCMLVGI